MIMQWYFISLLCCGFIVLINGLFDTREPFSMENLDLEDLVRKNGYPFELHYVKTKDNYVLAMHRIPPNDSSQTNGTQNQRVVLIMHGLLGCSADWVLTGRNRSLAYLLSDNGYDVWLGNNRGTTNSKNHTKLSTESSQFWDFSWHEMGFYDSPAMIDYILNHTGQKKLFYIGFSQGTTQFWILTSLRPEYNEKIKLMSALAPVAYLGNASGILRPLSFFVNIFKRFFKFIGFFEFLSSTIAMKRIGAIMCQEGAITLPLCEIIISMIGGFSEGEFDRIKLIQYLQFAPAGCSVKQMVHYSIGIQNPGHFQPYDYGALTNLRIYRRLLPPEYPIEKITAPVILYNGLNDNLASPKDVELLNRKLPNIVEKFTVTLKKLSHFDFVYGLHVRDLVYNHLIQKMNSIL